MNTVTELKNILNRKWPGAAFQNGSRAVLSTGIEPIDALLPHYGIPFGQLIEIAGPPSSGKTSLLYKMLTTITSKSSAAYFDLDNSFFPSAATYFGVDIDRLVIVKAENVPVALRAAEILLQHQKTGCIVIDLVDEKKTLPMTLLHRLRMQTVKSRGLTIFLTEDNSQIIPSSIISLRLSVSRLGRKRVAVEITKSRISKEGQKARVELYE